MPVAFLAGMLVGTCLAQHDSNATSAPLSTLVEEKLCAANSVPCHERLPCCGEMTCESLMGGSGRVCVEKQPRCVQENGVCGGPGQLTQCCCGDMQCKGQLRGGQMRCRESQTQCVRESGICGGPGQVTASCCGDMQCKRVLGGSQMQCAVVSGVSLASSGSAPDLVNLSESPPRSDVAHDRGNLTHAEGASSEEFLGQGSGSEAWCAAESQNCHWWRPCCSNMQCQSLLGASGRVCVKRQPQCVQEHGICGGPGQATRSCCGDMQCERLLGGSQLRCQKSQPQCVQEDGVCGGPGQLTASCCGDMKCQQLLGGSEMHCRRSQHQCVQQNGICRGPGQLTQSCCGSLHCKQLLGGSQMECLP